MNNRITVIARVAAVVLTLQAGMALAQAEVKFVSPEKFSDAGESERDRDDALKVLATHFEEQAAKQLPGKQLKIEVKDVDLAGEIEPRGSGMQRIRVMRSATIPRITLSYVLSEGGKELKRGDASLTDLSYQTATMVRYGPDDPMRYEKKLIDDWMSKELVGKPSSMAKGQ